MEMKVRCKKCRKILFERETIKEIQDHYAKHFGPLCPNERHADIEIGNFE